MTDSPSRGEIIVLAGIDGSGKSTQSQALVSRLQADGRAVHTISYPRYEASFFGRVVRKYLNGRFGDASAIDPHLGALAYAADRWESLPLLNRWISEGAFVLCDRYVSANKAHQGGKIPDDEERRAFYAWIDEMEYGVYALPRPALQILLWLPVELAKDLAQARARRDGIALDDRERNVRHMIDAANAYRELTEIEPDWVVIDCAPDGELLDAQAISDRIWDTLRERLPTCFD